MKFYSRPLFIIYLVTALLLLNSAIWLRHHDFSPEKKIAPQHLTLFKATPHAQKIKDALTSKSEEARPSLHGSPAPLYKPSEEELDSFPGAVVIEAVETEGFELHQKIHLRILKTHFKSCSASSGLIRTEEIIDDQTGELVDRQEMLADHLLVSLPAGEDPQHFLEQLGTQALSINKVNQDGSLHNLTLRKGSLEAIPQALEMITTLEGIVAEPDFMANACGSNTPNFCLYDVSSGLALHNQWGLWEMCGGIDIYEAWKVQRGAPSVIVGVLDSGIRYTHEDLAGNIWCDPAETKEGNLHGIDTIQENGDSMDLEDGHGTHCAGIIGGMGVNGGTFGIAPKVQLMACRVLDTHGVGSQSDLITCMDYAVRHGATILNCSMVFHSPYSNTSCYSKLLFEAIQKVQAAGVILVAAAGNAATKKNWDNSTLFIPNNNDKHPTYPASYELDNIISVAASNFSWLSICDLSPDSNYGAATVHIAAPGVHILSTSSTADNSYIHFSGTSMATAFVSGSLALLKEHYPQASYQALIRHLFANTDNALMLQGKIIGGRHLNIGRALQTPLQE